MAINEKHARSVVATSELLKSVIAEPSSYEADVDFIATLKSQGRLAKYENASLSITSCALNTLKTAADEILEDGYEGLEQLRKSAILTINGHSEKREASNKSSKLGLAKLVAEQELEITKLEQHNVLLTSLVVELMSKARKYANRGDATTKALCAKEMKEVSTQISFSQNSKLVQELIKNGS
ncbi:hypothetical protein [Parashewanella tropica]|uniref:hypothetical protein n=1 Tax=Parashewanella tropica TaxID=2547970 RepID=UPI0010599505|nr:hypothetical protein [Parashewanella tropica]